jgi:hypothetical protein
MEVVSAHYDFGQFKDVMFSVFFYVVVADYVNDT